MQTTQFPRNISSSQSFQGRSHTFCIEPMFSIEECLSLWNKFVPQGRNLVLDQLLLNHAIHNSGPIKTSFVTMHIKHKSHRLRGPQTRKPSGTSTLQNQEKGVQDIKNAQYHEEKMQLLQQFHPKNKVTQGDNSYQKEGMITYSTDKNDVIQRPPDKDTNTKGKQNSASEKSDQSLLLDHRMTQKCSKEYPRNPKSRKACG